MTAEEFLATYFGADNINPEELSQELRDWLEPWIQEVRSGVESFVLPRRRPGSSSCYYAMARSDEAGRRLLEELEAFVGPSYGRLDRQPVALDTADPIDAAVLSYAGRRCWTIRPVSDDSSGRKQLRDALGLLRSVRSQRPPWAAREIRPLGRVLRDFESAVFRRDTTASSVHLAELERGGLLSLENLRFLHVRRLAALGMWHELRKDERFRTLQDGRRPAGVSDLLLEALWHTDVSNSVPASDAHALAAFVRDKLVPQFGALFSTACYAQSPGSLRVAMAFAVAVEPPRRDLIDLFLGRAAKDKTLLASLSELAALQQAVGREPEQSVLLQASNAINSAQPDLALKLLRNDGYSEPVRRAELLVTAAFALDGLDAAVVAAKAVEALDEAEGASVSTTPSFGRMLEWVKKTVGGTEKNETTAVSDWDAWVEVVDADPDWVDALRVARRGASEWDLTEWLDEPTRVTSLAERLVADRPPTAAARIQDALGPIVEFTSRLRTAGMPAVPLLDALRHLLVADERRSPEDLEMLAELTERLLQAGRSPRDYTQTVEDLFAVWTEVMSYERLDWGLRVLDTLARFPAPNPEPRLSYLASVAGVLERSRHRIDDVDLAWFSILADECGSPDVVPEIEVGSSADVDGSPWRWLDGKSLGLHCLMEQAALRAVGIVQRLSQPSDVEIDASVACTGKLKEFAGRHDVIVVISQHAKHAATDCIKDNVSGTTLVVWPRQHSIGTSGIVRALADAITGLALDAAG